MYAFASVACVMGAMILFLAAEGTVYYPLVPVVSLLTCFVITRFFGCASGIAASFVLLSFLFVTGYFGSLLSTSETARFTEVLILTFGSILCACWLRIAESKFHRLQQESTSLSAALMAVEQRQRGFLREVLASVTDQRLCVCDSADELPEIVSVAEAETPVRLTSSVLYQVRARIRKAGDAAGLADSAIEELVIAGSEAALNAVVHGKDGVAEVYSDPLSGRVQVWVRDNGAGIEEQMLHRATLERGFSSAGTLGQGFALIVSASHRVFLLTGKTGTTVVIEGERQ